MSLRPHNRKTIRQALTAPTGWFFFKIACLTDYSRTSTGDGDFLDLAALAADIETGLVGGNAHALEAVSYTHLTLPTTP